MIINILWFTFYIAGFVFIWMFLGYPATLWLISKLRKHTHFQEAITPNVTVIICTYNESVTIERRICNLIESDYPKENMEIVVADSNSPDGTQDVVQSMILKYPDYKIKLITEEERRGKVSAINLGLSVANGDIVILTDSPALFWKDTIRFIVRNFADPTVGAASGNFVKCDTETANYQQDTEWVVFNYRKLLRRLEARVDSTTWLSGELTAFRKSLIPKILPSVIIDDAHIAFNIREQGYRVVIDEEAKYAEKRPTTYAETVTIKIKSVTGSVREMVRFRKLLFNIKYKYFGLLIMPARLLHFYLNPFILLTLVLSSLGLIWLYFGPPTLFILIGTGLIFLLLISLFRNGKLLKPIIAFFLMEWIILAGLYQYFTGNYSAVWKQVKTTRNE
ncbi:MAG: glycosyltransferase [Anaerolineaceae bacterium]